MKQRVIIEKILRSMTSRFDYVICLIEESNNLDTLTIDELKNGLLVHEQRRNRRVSNEQALNVTYDNRIGGRGGDRAREFFEEEVDIHSTKLQLSVTSVIR